MIQETLNPNVRRDLCVNQRPCCSCNTSIKLGFASGQLEKGERNLSYYEFLMSHFQIYVIARESMVVLKGERVV